MRLVTASSSKAFVVTEVDWIWGDAQEVPGLATLNQGGPAEINSVSCAAPGHCTAGGYYHDSSGNQQVFIVNQRCPWPWKSIRGWPC